MDFVWLMRNIHWNEFVLSLSIPLKNVFNINSLSDNIIKYINNHLF